MRCLAPTVLVWLLCVSACAPESLPGGNDAATDSDVGHPDHRACTPQCDDRVCGDDGCGGQCGQCPEGAACILGTACGIPCTVGQPCSDDDPCTQGDQCVAGSCAGEPVVCDDGLECTKDSCDPTTGCRFDLRAGFCLIDGACYANGDVDSGNSCRECASAVATEQWSSDDTNSCSDEDACTLGDSCQDGECVPTGGTLQCDDDNPCTDDECQADSGCVHQPNQKPCSDDNPCHQPGTCAEGKCVMEQVDCDDDNPCTVDVCDPVKGCQHLPTSGDCDDGDACTLGDHCEGGLCAAGSDTPECDDGNVCTADSCQPAKGCVHSPVGGACDDGNPCSLGDTCLSGACQPGQGQLLCNDGNVCTGDTCQPGVGCVHTPVAAACNDNNACTLGDKCEQGICQPGSLPTICQDADPCTTDSCDPATGCNYVFNNASCDDGNACTDQDTCSLGNCNGTPKVCQDNNPCTADSCDPAKAGGCVFLPTTQPCDDGNVCTLGDLCGEGICQPGLKAKQCNDFNACTTDSCDPVTGCQHAAASGPCEDGDPCTTQDFCSGGFCLSGQNACVCENDDQCAVFDDGNLCNGTWYCNKEAADPWTWTCAPQPDSAVVCDHSQDQECLVAKCQPETGLCKLSVLADGSECDDGNFCTANDQCQEGTCHGDEEVACDDGSPCTEDSCVGGWGCLHSPLADGLPCLQDGWVCKAGECVQCFPDCDGKECGSDGCGGSCGTCLVPLTCQFGLCLDGSQTCDQIGPVGQCQGSVVLWCQDGQVMQIDCGAEGKLCTYLPEYGTYGCKADCGNVPAEGSCDKTVLDYCGADGLVSVNCAQFGMSCAFDNGKGKYSCVNGCGDIDTYGQCDGNILYYCDSPYGQGGDVVVENCAENGESCVLVDDSVGYDCVDACGGIPETGLCQGQVLVHCDTDQSPPVVVEEDCGAQGLKCDLVSPTDGYACVVSGGGTHLVKGTIEFEKRDPSQTGLGQAYEVSAVGVKVAVWDTQGTTSKADDEVLATGMTDESGAYSLSYFGGDTDVYVVAYSWWSKGAYVHHVDVPDYGADDGHSTLGVAGSKFAPQAEVTQSMTITEDDGAGAFNILDRLRVGRAFAATSIGHPPSFYVQWDGPDNYYCDYGSYYSPKEQYIHIAHCSGDGDEYDDSVILHEMGHHVSFTLSQDDNPGGAHWVEWTVDPRMAWSEGFASFFGQAVLGQPVYLDTSDWDVLVFDLEGANSLCKAKAYLGMKQDICEALVGAALWDIFDADNDTGDDLTLDEDEILTTMGDYLGPGTFQDRGVSGADLVDMLDGWFCQGNGYQTELDELVVDNLGFPYDFGGPCQKIEAPFHLIAQLPDARDGRVLEVTVRPLAELPDLSVRVHLPDGALLHRDPVRSVGRLAAGQEVTLRFALAAPVREPVGVSAHYAPHPALRVSRSAVTGPRPEEGEVRFREGRMPWGARARVRDQESSLR